MSNTTHTTGNVYGLMATGCPTEAPARIRRPLDKTDATASHAPSGRPYTDEEKTLLNTPARTAFRDALAAIEAAFKGSPNPQRTREALRYFVDATAAEA